MAAVISIMFADSHGVTFRTADYWSKTHTHHQSNTIILLQRTIIDYFCNDNVLAAWKCVASRWKSDIVLSIPNIFTIDWYHLAGYTSVLMVSLNKTGLKPSTAYSWTVYVQCVKKLPCPFVKGVVSGSVNFWILNAHLQLLVVSVIFAFKVYLSRILHDMTGIPDLNKNKIIQHI